MNNGHAISHQLQSSGSRKMNLISVLLAVGTPLIQRPLHRFGCAVFLPLVFRLYSLARRLQEAMIIISAGRGAIHRALIHRALTSAMAQTMIMALQEFNKIMFCPLFFAQSSFRPTGRRITLRKLRSIQATLASGNRHNQHQKRSGRQSGISLAS